MGCGGINGKNNEFFLTKDQLFLKYFNNQGNSKKLKGFRLDTENQIATEKVLNESNPIFREDMIEHGDESGSVQPWIVNIVAPEVVLEEKKFPPPIDLKIEHVFGFRCYDIRHNVLFVNSKFICYINGALGIVHNLENNHQKIFGGLEWEEEGSCHDDDAVSIAVYKGDVSMIATGQIDNKPSIIVWSPFDPKVVYSIFRMSSGTKQATNLKFDKTGEHIASVGLDSDHTFFVFNIQTKSLEWKGPTGKNIISGLEFNPLGNEFCIVGVKTVLFLYLSRKMLKNALVKNSKYVDMTFTNVAYNQEGVCFTSTSTGTILMWKECIVIREIQITNSMIDTFLYNESTDQFYLSDADKNIFVLTQNKIKNKLSIAQKTTVNSHVMSLDVNEKGEMLLGMRNGSIILKQKNGDKEITQSHSRGRVLGLEFVPENYILTTGEDNKIFLWNILTKTCEQQAFLSEKEVKRTSTNKKAFGMKTKQLPPEECSQCISYNKLFDHIAIGLNSGYVSIRRSIKQLNEKYLNDIKISTGEITEIKYSPDMKLLAVTSSKLEFYILEIKSGYSITHKLRGHDDFINQLDWDISSRFLQVVTVANNFLFFDIETRENIYDPMNTRSIKWSSQTCKFGYNVQGIFNGSTDPNFINSVAMSNSKSLIASGDDDKFLNIYNYPCIKDNPELKRYYGHSDSVTRVLFNDKDTKIFSVGDQDTSVIVWSVHNK